jgi:integrase
VRSVLHQAMALAVEDGAVVRNPVDVIRLPQARPREVHPLTAAQVRALVAAADGHRLQALFVLALTSGARAGELLATRWDDLDLPAGILSVRKSLQRVKGGGLVLGAPKTATSLRRIDLPALAVAALAAHQARQAEERAAAGSSWRDLGFVFCSPTGSPLDESNVYKRQWLPLLAAAGIPPMRLHDARHSHASLLLDQGESVKVVQERLGHADPRTTLHLYGHVMPGAHRRAAETLDAVLSTPEALAAEPSEAPSKGTKRARERR